MLKIGLVLNGLRLKATNEWQDDGAGMLHIVTHFPIDQVYFAYGRRPCPSPPMQGDSYDVSQVRDISKWCLLTLSSVLCCMLH